jgi:hypothetical protein
MSAMFRALRADGVSFEMARQRIAGMSPFNLYPQIVGSLGDIEE